MADVKIDGQTYTDVDILNLEDTDGNEVKFYTDEKLRLDYSKQLTGKPKINGVKLDGDKTLEELGIVLNNSDEKWELIQDITVEEDCNSVEYTTDLNGNPFELKKAIVIGFYNIATAEDANNTGFGVSFSKAPFWNGTVMIKAKFNNTFTFCAEEIDGRLYISNLAVSYNAGMNNSLGHDSNISNFWHRDALKQNDYYLPMTKIAIGSYAKAIGAGTQIILLGIRKVTE